jgi:Uncharacterized conserved protein (DUF2190)
MPATSNFTMAKGRRAASAITKKRFVKLVADGNDEVEQCDADGEDAYGVAIFSVSTAEIAKKKLVSVHTDGRAIVEASEEIKVGEPVKTTNDGRAGVATTGDVVLGMCDEPAADAGSECSVDLSKRGGTL